MDTEAERNQVLNLFYIRHVYISILSMFSKYLFFFNNVINSLLNEDLWESAEVYKQYRVNIFENNPSPESLF